MTDGDYISNPQIQEYYNILSSQSSANNLFNAQQAEKQMDFQTKASAKAMEFNHREAELNRQWQEMMSNTAYQRQVSDMIKAGLNPVLGVSNSGASVPSGATASVTASAGAKADADTTVNQALSNFVAALVNGATQREVAGINSAASMHNAELGASATMYAANQSSSAMKYAANMSYAASKYATDWQKEYAQNYNPIGIVKDFYDYITGEDNSKSVGDAAGTFFNKMFADGFVCKSVDGRTVRVNSLDTLKYWYDKITNNSKELIKYVVNGYLYGYKNIGRPQYR